MDKALKYNSISLGTAIFVFGFLKLFNPFNTWFHIQIAKTGLPASPFHWAWPERSPSASACFWPLCSDRDSVLSSGWSLPSRR